MQGLCIQVHAPYDCYCSLSVAQSCDSCVMFDFVWRLAGSRMRKLFIHPTWSRRLNVSFAMLMVATLAWSFTLTQ